MAEAASGLRWPQTRKFSGFWAFLVTFVPELAIFCFTSPLPRAIALALLIALPACSGLLAVLIYGQSKLRGYEECLRVSEWAVAWFYLTLFVLAVLGLPILALYILNVIYLSVILYSALFLPFAIVLAAAGGSLGYLIQRTVPRKAQLAEAQNSGTRP
jgi:hypothetical protein